jgi:hypothetical protein
VVSFLFLFSSSSCKQATDIVRSTLTSYTLYRMIEAENFEAASKQAECQFMFKEHSGFLNAQTGSFLDASSHSFLRTDLEISILLSKIEQRIGWTDEKRLLLVVSKPIWSYAVAYVNLGSLSC